MPSTVQNGSSAEIEVAPYHGSPLRAPSTGNKKEYHLKVDIRDEDRRKELKHSHMNIISLCNHYLGSGLFVAPLALNHIANLRQT